MYDLLLDSLRKLSKVESIGIYSPLANRDDTNFKQDPHPIWPGIAAQKVLDEAQSKIPDLYEYYAHKSLLNMVLAAVAESGIHLKELKTTAGALGIDALKVRSEYLTPSLRRLDTLSLSFELHKFLYSSTKPPTNHLPTFLSFVPNLTTLDLTFPSEHGTWGRPLTTNRVFDRWLSSFQIIHFQHLETLKLARFCTLDDNFKAFTALHAATLRAVRLEQCTVQDLGNVMDNMANELQLEELVVLEPSEYRAVIGIIIHDFVNRSEAAATRVLVTNMVGKAVVAKPDGMRGGREWALRRDRLTTLGG
ncbi:uncharacterized protein BDZ99DRAFT_528137 [Mytilinidion resinicola]|uniref:F-box domain-containing protein n=1 Tax=Mytilinidion resinicola TaxID=574789 RepID=A0A6A6Y0X4_9PEZI|nr:uncharacterized protein BDZ99DRAFT_528137 [Mytilinidion resinicola]KAF2801664.1 hypothetical protein BDZ99DRAFT_528137 [Mytilinidion resinicola]